MRAPGQGSEVDEEEKIVALFTAACSLVTDVLTPFLRSDHSIVAQYVPI